MSPFGTFLLTLTGFGFGYAIGFLRRERANQREWVEYQSFLAQQRDRLTARFRRDIRA